MHYMMRGRHFVTPVPGQPILEEFSGVVVEKLVRGFACSLPVEGLISILTHFFGLIEFSCVV